MAEHDIFPPNSDKARSVRMKIDAAKTKADRPKGKQIATRLVEQDGAFKRFVKMFLADDLDEIDLKKYLFRGLIIPSIRDVFYEFLGTVLYNGDSRQFSGKENTPYHEISKTSKIRTIGQRQSEPEPKEEHQKEKFDFNLIPFASQAQAKSVLTAMKLYLESYPDGVSVGYLQELLGETGDYPSEYYGWTDLSEAKIRPTTKGRWLLVLPDPVRL